MKKKSILSVLSMFLMIVGACITVSCGSDNDPIDYSDGNMKEANDSICGPDNSTPPPYYVSIVGDYLKDVSGETGIARLDHERFPIAAERYHNIEYIETANGDRYYLFPLTPPDPGAGENDFLGGDIREEFYKEFVIGEKMEFSGKVYKINPEYVALDALFAEILKTTNVYIMRAPEFSVKRISE
ncbi:MAG: hypothetical protein J5506_04150 [Prevotella sp.]|nr:hypothetical protein [Prevotella sp.]